MKLRILVTAGATREPIDGVRFLSNFSTGQTGADLASEWSKIGHEVQLLAGEGAVVPSVANCEVTRFQDFTSLDSLLRARLSEIHFDLVVHLAAVSDYSVAEIQMSDEKFSPDTLNKLNSNAPEIRLLLKRNTKIVDHLRSYAAKVEKRESTVFVAFKLTQNANEAEKKQKVSALFEHSKVDFVVQNDLENCEKFDDRGFLIYRRNDRSPVRATQTLELAQKLLAAVEGRLFI